MKDALDLKQEICARIRADPAVRQWLVLDGLSEEELRQHVIPRRYMESALTENTRIVSVFSAAGQENERNTSFPAEAVQIEILVPEAASLCADHARRCICALLDGACIADKRLRQCPDPGPLSAATGFYRVAVRFRFYQFVKG